MPSAGPLPPGADDDSPCSALLARYTLPAVVVAASVLATRLLNPTRDIQFIVAVLLIAGDPLLGVGSGSRSRAMRLP